MLQLDLLWSDVVLKSMHIVKVFVWRGLVRCQVQSLSEVLLNSARLKAFPPGNICISYLYSDPSSECRPREHTEKHTAQLGPANCVEGGGR